MRKLNKLHMMVQTGEKPDGEKIYERDEVKLDINSTTHGVLSANRISNLDSGKITSGVLDIARIPQVPWTQVSGKPSTFLPSSHTHPWGEVTGKPNANQYPDTAESLGANANLNNYRTPGFYYQNYNANTSSALNYPANVAGTLIVTEDAGVTQMYYEYYRGGVWYRTYYNGTWTSWVNLMTPSWANVTGKPSTFAPSSHSHSELNSGGGSWNYSRTGAGYIQFGPANEGYAHIYTDRPQFYFNKEIQINGNQVMHRGNTSDFVVERGYNYRRWSSGTQECWGETLVNPTTSMNLFGSTRYYGSASESFPKAFKNTDIRVFTTSNSSVPWHAQSGATRTATSITIHLSRHNTSGTSVHWYAIGAWK